MRSLRLCDEAGIHHQGQKAVLLLLLRSGYQAWRKDLSGGKIGSATIEETVLEESRKIFKSPYFLEKVSAKTGLTIPEVRESFSESFWAEITEQELNRLYAELFERVVLKENQLIYDIKTSGVQNLIEGVMQ